jgi:hypothetical protein
MKRSYHFFTKLYGHTLTDIDYFEVTDIEPYTFRERGQTI